MQYKTFGDTVVIRLDIEDEICKSIYEVCEKENITAGTITGIGAVNHVIVGVYKVSEKKYYPVECNEEMEVTSLTGNVSTLNDKTYIHMHTNIARSNGQVIGGHLNEAKISVTGEIFIRKIDGKIKRKVDEKTGINILDFD